jgi:hypothetical protein
MVRVVNAKSGEEKMFDWEGLRKYSVAWYAKQGVDLSAASMRLRGD